MIDSALLEYEMKKRKLTKRDMCNSLNISRTAFYRKCNGISEFTQSEMQSISCIIGKEAMVNIFFSN